MKIHILGICGTFMASLAVIAKALGHSVSGSDDAIFPPMSTMLAEQGIKIYPTEVCALKQLKIDCVIVGNAKSRGDINVEFLLNSNIPYYSGPEWLARNLLQDRWVITAAGTHGKTTTSSMVAWILAFAKHDPGFLIGGLPQNFGLSGRVGQGPFFVIEGDEYDTAFFDKRSKFVHYHTKTAIVNNIEFDHGDIFENLASIQTQFHHYIRTVPNEGLVVANAASQTVADMLDKGCWSPIEGFGAKNARWQATLLSSDGSHFEVLDSGKKVSEVSWDLLGMHNVNNALAAIAAANHAGVPPKVAGDGLSAFKGVKRRLELRGTVNNVTVYDDFAHHPTEIKTTLNGLRQKVGDARILTVIEFVSNSMARGFHNDALVGAFSESDAVFCRQPDWDVKGLFAGKGRSDVVVCDTVSDLLASITKIFRPGDHIVVMSNKAFGGIYEKLLEAAEALMPASL